MLSPATRAAYRRDGFIVLPEILTLDEVEGLRRVTDQFVDNARTVAANDDVYDLEESHSPNEPRVRRIKTPHLHDPEYARAARHPRIVEVLRDLWGTVRFDTGKLNMKSAGYGAPIEWHQDWAFYPHTNEDLAAVGIMLDDCDMDNGPMMVIPGCHQGPIYDHYGRDGRFCGAIDPDAAPRSGSVRMARPQGNTRVLSMKTSAPPAGGSLRPPRNTNTSRPQNRSRLRPG
jgi:phytanoyl-CoA hydroxylase